MKESRFRLNQFFLPITPTCLNLKQPAGIKCSHEKGMLVSAGLQCAIADIEWRVGQIQQIVLVH